MLRTAEKQMILRYIGYCCTFGLLPARVDLARSELRPLASWKYSVPFVLFVINAIHEIGSLVHTFFFKEDTPMHHMIVHIMLAVAAPMYCHWYYVIFIKHPGVFRTYLKMTMTGNAEVSGNGKRRSWSRLMKECTLRELYVLGLPYLTIPAALSIILAFACYPSMSILMYARIPQELQSWPIGVILFLEDSRCVLARVCIGVPIWTVQVMSIELVNNRLQQLINSLQRNVDQRRLNEVYLSLRHIQLYLGMSNLLNSFLIFSCKICFITICIITGYSAIAHFKEYPIFGLLNYILLLNGIFIYTFTYGRAFQIPQLFDDAAQSAVRAASVCRMDKLEDFKIYKLQIRSIPRLGMKVGEFHLLERVSTLIFIDYVVNNIVSMLVAYE